MGSKEHDEREAGTKLIATAPSNINQSRGTPLRRPINDAARECRPVRAQGSDSDDDRSIHDPAVAMRERASAQSHPRATPTRGVVAPALQRMVARCRVLNKGEYHVTGQ